MSPYPLPLASASHPPYPTPLGGHKAPADLPVLCGCFPLAIYLTFGSVYKDTDLLENGLEDLGRGRGKM